MLHPTSAHLPTAGLEIRFGVWLPLPLRFVLPFRNSPPDVISLALYFCADAMRPAIVSFLTWL